MANQLTSANDHRARLWLLVDNLVQDHRLILASNRGPMEFTASESGEPEGRRGSGGVVTALSGLTNHVDFTWIACAMSEGDRRMAESNPGIAIRSPVPGQQVSVKFVTPSRRAYHKYYNVICNPLLWFLQHYMWSSPYTPRIDADVYDAWRTGYVEVNQKFADSVVEEARSQTKKPVVMVHDYQLYLVPKMVRVQMQDAQILHFSHIPWPAASYWELLPALMRTAICDSLCNADIVGFQAIRDVREFLQCCDSFLDDVTVDYRERVVHYQGREILVRQYPISIDVEEISSIASSPRAQEYSLKLERELGEQTIVRVDRAEPSKNIVRGFAAFDVLLERHPELLGKVRFLAFLVPSRTHIRQYQRYIDEIDTAVRQVNERYSIDSWQPIKVFYENNYVQALAAMRLYDVLLVNSVIDGMNLVAKEGPMVNDKNGVLILSETTGAYEQLKAGVLPVAPADIEGTYLALYNALTMDPSERSTRTKAITETITREDITDWLYRQVADLATLGR